MEQQLAAHSDSPWTQQSHRLFAMLTTGILRRPPVLTHTEKNTMKLRATASLKQRQILEGVVMLVLVVCVLVLPSAAKSKKKADPTLTINVLGSGTVSAVPIGPNYATGQLVTLTANPSPGWTFSSWSGNLT